MKKELMDLQWTKNKSPNIIKMINWFNKISSNISYLIVSEKNIKNRSKLIEKSINLAYETYKINNFNSLFEIVSGLEDASVFRVIYHFILQLKKSWSLISPNSLKIFQELKDVVNTKGNFNFLRNLYTKNEVILPYLGLFLTDLTFIEEGNKNIINNRINFDKRRKLSKIVKNIIFFQNGFFKFRPVNEIILYLTDKVTNINKNDLYDISKKNESKE
jgi:son of sevenless-like protein